MHSLLAFRFLFGQTQPHVFRDQVVPVKFSSWSLAHGGLERPELSNCLQLLDGFNGLLQELRIWIAFCRLVADSFESNRVFLQMLRRSVEEVLQLKTMGIGVTRSLLEKCGNR